jgi:hypothetical protein
MIATCSAEVVYFTPIFVSTTLVRILACAFSRIYTYETVKNAARPQRCQQQRYSAIYGTNPSKNHTSG